MEVIVDGAKKKIKCVDYEDIGVMYYGTEPVCIRISEEMTSDVARRINCDEKDVIKNDFIRIEKDFATGDWHIVLGERMIDIVLWLNKEKLIPDIFLRKHLVETDE